MLILSHYAFYSLLARFLHVYPPPRRIFLSLSLLVTRIHALLSTNMLYGPILSPYQLFSTITTSLVSATNASCAPVINALIYTLFFHLIVFHLHIYSAPRSAFSQLTVRRSMLSVIPYAFLTVIVPAIPTVLFALDILLRRLPPRARFKFPSCLSSHAPSPQCMRPPKMFFNSLVHVNSPSPVTFSTPAPSIHHHHCHHCFYDYYSCTERTTKPDRGR